MLWEPHSNVMRVWDISHREKAIEREINPNLYKDANNGVKNQDIHFYGGIMATRNQIKT